MLDAQRKIYVGMNQVKFFYYKPIKFKSESFRHLDSELMEDDRKEFSIKTSIKPNIEMIEYMYESMMKHWIKQTDKEAQAAKFRLRIYEAITFGYNNLFYFIFFYYLFNFLKNFAESFFE